MKIDPEDFRRHYSSLSDEALLEIARDELVPVAQQIYDEEIALRHFAPDDPDGQPAALEEPQTSGLNVNENWLENGACAYSSFIGRVGDDATQRMVQARDSLAAAGIPAELRYRKEKYQDRDEADLCELLVPANLILYADSVLNKELFNAEVEEAHRTYFSSLSDEELRSADRRLLFAGLVDRLERVRKAYDDEVAKRARAANA